MAIAFTWPKPKFANRDDKDFDNLPPKDLIVEVLSHNNGNLRSILILAPMEEFDCGKSGILFKPKADKKIRSAFKRARGYKYPSRNNQLIDMYCLKEYLKGKNKIQICDLVITKFENEIKEQGGKFNEKMVEKAIDRALKFKWVGATEKVFCGYPFEAAEIISALFHVTGIVIADEPNLFEYDFRDTGISIKRRGLKIAFNTIMDLARENVPKSEWTIRAFECFFEEKLKGGHTYYYWNERIPLEIRKLKFHQVMSLLHIAAGLIKFRI